MAMARMMRISAVLALLLCLICTSEGKASALKPEIPPPQAVEAAQFYWGGFDTYEQNLMKDGRGKYEQTWQNLKRAYDAEKREINETQIEILKQAVAKYDEHIKEYPEAPNISYVMLNLAQLLGRLADHYSASAPDSAAAYRQQAIDVLGDITKKDPNFAFSEAVLYTTAITFESMGMNEKALVTWQQLAAKAENSQYGLYALIALGDHMFEGEEAEESLNQYIKAKKLLNKIKLDDPHYERVRVLYRLVWAGYRAAQLKVCVDAGTELLIAGTTGKNKKYEESLRADAVDVMGDAMYEQNDIDETKVYLSRKNMSIYAPAIGLRVMRNYMSRDRHKDVIEVAELLVQKFPTSTELPDILTILSSSYQKTDNLPKYTATLEELALLLPGKSLWRSRHASAIAAVDDMEKKSVAATLLLAEHYYVHGMKTANVSSFKSAITYYDLLTKNLPNDPQCEEWRLKAAHSYYFAEQFDNAEKIYVDLKTKYKIRLSNLKIASYQLALTREKLWRQAFAASAMAGRKPIEDAKVIAKLDNLEQSIEEYANKFPFDKVEDAAKSNNEELFKYDRVVDLLLLAASALRDHEVYDKASQYWQRALVSHPSPAQRGIAIRGLILAAVAAGSPEDVVKLTQQFLKLEDWKSLGSSLDNELEGVLANAAKQQSENLADSGNSLAAGTLLLTIAQEYPRLPDRERIYRDGAYLVAIGGEWRMAQSAADAYLQEGLKELAADMTYLKGRSEEYQMRFGDAAASYLKMGTTYKKHSRAMNALESARKLAAAEEDYALAAKASAAFAAASKDRQDQIKHYRAAVDYAQKAGNSDNALNYAKNLADASVDRQDKLVAEMISAKIGYKAGNQTAALETYKKVARETKQRESIMDGPVFAELYGESNFLLGEEARAKFDDFIIKDRGGSLVENLKQKLKYLDSMTRYYLEAAKSGHPTWQPQSNYMIGVATESLADEVAALPFDTSLSLDGAQQEKLKSQADRLRKVAQNYFGKNLQLRNRNPVAFHDNVWIKRSNLKLFGKIDMPQKNELSTILPDEVGNNLISQWSI